MTKGSDSREFFEVFKQPKQQENTEDAQKSEVKPPAQLPPNIEPQTTPPNAENKVVATSPLTTDPLAWIKNTQKEDITYKHKPEAPKTSNPIPDFTKSERVQRKDEVVLRQETLIIGAIAATFLSIACFFVGHKVGYNKGVMKQTEEWLGTMESSDTKKIGFIKSEPQEAPQKNIVKPAAERTEKQPEKQFEQPKPIIKDKWTLRAVTYTNTKENIEKAKEIARTLQNGLGYNAFVVNTGKELFVCLGEFEANDSTDLINAKDKLSNFSYENKKQFEGCYPVRMK